MLLVDLSTRRNNEELVHVRLFEPNQVGLVAHGQLFGKGCWIAGHSYEAVGPFRKAQCRSTSGRPQSRLKVRLVQVRFLSWPNLDTT